MNKKLTLSSLIISTIVLLMVNYCLAQDPFIKTNPFGSDENASNGTGWADYDDDGWEDLYISNGSDFGGQNNFLYKNNGDGSFTKITTGDIVTDALLSGSTTWGDFDNDGDLDLFVPTLGSLFGGNAQNALYENLGDGSFLKNTTAGPLVSDTEHAAAASWDDYNNDNTAVRLKS